MENLKVLVYKPSPAISKPLPNSFLSVYRNHMEAGRIQQGNETQKRTDTMSSSDAVHIIDYLRYFNPVNVILLKKY